MSEVLVASRWLYDTLQDVAPGGAWSDVAPPHVKDPYIVFSMTDANDVRVVDGIRVLTDALYTVKAVAETETYAGLETYASQIDTALHNASSVVTDGLIVWCVRERPVAYSETTDGLTYKHLGGMYRLQVRKE